MILNHIYPTLLLCLSHIHAFSPISPTSIQFKPSLHVTFSSKKQPFLYNNKVDSYHRSLSLSSNSDISYIESDSFNSTDGTSIKQLSNVPTSITKLTILQAAFLIAGTTIGGGFLALPTVISPAGFLPSTATLTSVWAYFVAQSFILVECLVNERNREQDSNVSSSFSASPGVSATAFATFGKAGEQITRLLLIVLTQATLVSQISRAGTLILPNQYILGCILSSVSIAAIVFGPSKGKGIIWSTRANSVLLWLFLFSAGWVGISGVQNVAQASYWAVLSSAQYQHWDAVPRAIPTFLQLLVYGEIIPVVCDLLQFRVKAIKMSILMGSLLTLGLQLGWSALGTVLVTPTAGVVVDPVNVLLGAGGAMQVPLFCLAITAILTTILGSYLALFSAFQDWMSGAGHDTDKDSSMMQSQENRNGEYPWRIRLAVASLISLPALCISSISPDLFLKAIDFAGSYPVLLLWGVIPPAMALTQRWRKTNLETINESGDSSIVVEQSEDLSKNIGGPTVWLIMLMTLSIGMVANSARQDLTWLIAKLVSVFTG